MRDLVRAGGAALALGLATPAAMAADEGIALAVIDLTPVEGSLRIEARAVAVEAADIAGELQIERSGKSGNVSTRQSTHLELASGETGRVAAVGVSYAPGDQLTITLTLRRDEEVIARTVVSAGGG